MSAHEPFHFHSLADLESRIRELGLDLPVHPDAGPLLESIRVGARQLPNRMVVLPMEGCDGDADGAPGELTFRRYRRFAAGGSGLLWFEATAVVGEGRANPRQLWIQPKTKDAFARLVEASRRAAAERHGAGHQPMLVLQLTHSGRYSRPGLTPAPIIAHHSAFLDPLHNLPAGYPLISDDELERLEDAYVEAARLACSAGFDAVDVKACHRYLISELHASHTREDSRYGGPFENRSRFFRQVVEKIRGAVPGLVVTSRMNAYDAMAYPYGFGVDREDPSRPDLREPIALVRFLAAQGAPLVNITIGNPYFNPHVNRPFDLPSVGAPLPAESPLAGVTRFVHVVRAIQQENPSMAVIGGGYSWLRQFFPNVAAAAIANGWVSMVGAGRMAFAYPDYAAELASGKTLKPEKVCVACSACTQIMRDGGRSGCVPRDSEIYEPIYKAGRQEALDTILAEAGMCRLCNDPTCVSGCPAGVNVPKFIGEIASRQFRQAYETIREANALAAVCGYVCPAETLCESRCINRFYGEPVPIRHLQQWVNRKAIEEGWASAPRQFPPLTGRRVAVIGAGPAGIAAAAGLAAAGHSAVLIEKNPAPGGIAQETIPPDRLPGWVMDREAAAVLDAGQRVERRFGVEFGTTLTLDDLEREGFDTILLAAGLASSVPLPSAVRPSSGVVAALDFLRLVKRGERIEGPVLVLGGGNTAMDAARTALAAGASDVAVVYRRSFTEMPAWPGERDAALRAGVNFLTLTAPVGYESDDSGRLAGLRVCRTRLGVPGPDGRRQPEPIAGSEHVIPATMVVEAIGQQMDPAARKALAGIEFDHHGRIATRPGTLMSSRDGVFVAGDLLNGGTTVVQAVAEGARAAREINGYLAGKADQR